MNSKIQIYEQKSFQFVSFVFQLPVSMKLPINCSARTSPTSDLGTHPFLTDVGGDWLIFFSSSVILSVDVDIDDDEFETVKRCCCSIASSEICIFKLDQFNRPRRDPIVETKIVNPIDFFL